MDSIGFLKNLEKLLAISTQEFLGFIIASVLVMLVLPKEIVKEIRQRSIWPFKN